MVEELKWSNQVASRIILRSTKNDNKFAAWHQMYERLLNERPFLPFLETTTLVYLILGKSSPFSGGFSPLTVIIRNFGIYPINREMKRKKKILLQCKDESQNHTGM